MPTDFSLQERFWRDVAIAAGQGELDPRAILEAVEDMMRNYSLEEVPGFEAALETDALVPETQDFSRHSAFAPVFSRRASNMFSSWRCFNVARPIFFSPRCALRRRRSRPEPRNPDDFPGGGNPGIQTDTDQPPNPSTVQQVSPLRPQLQLPLWAPSHYIWTFPGGHLAWSPHPQPNPSIPQPLSPWAAVTLTGGHPLPGTMPQWTPDTWPPLDWAHTVPIRLLPHVIPNPNNAHLPLVDWNVTKHPSTAKRLTPNHVVVDMGSTWDEAVTDIEARRIVVTCDVGHMSTLWGPIVIDQSGDDARPVMMRDLFDAIYTYFQTPLTYPEVRYISDLHPNNYYRLTAAYHARCRESAALPGWEAMQGFRRADVLGDRKYWWGVWISSRDGTWWLNLGLMNSAHRIPRLL